MQTRNRQRWLCRLALGLALATAAFAGPAQAKYDAGSGGQGSRFVTTDGWSGYVDMESGVPLSAGLAGLQELQQQQTPRVADSPREYAGISAATRPDDRADRFVHSDPGTGSAPDGGSGIEWDDGVGLAIAALVLALAIGLGIGYLRRPRLAL